MNTNEIRTLIPCYDPTVMVPDNWEGTPLDVMLYDAPDGLPHYEDRIWLLSHTEFVDITILAELAIWCVERLKEITTDDFARLEEWVKRGDNANIAYVAARELAKANGGDWKPAADKLTEILRGAP